MWRYAYAFILLGCRSTAVYAGVFATQSDDCSSVCSLKNQKYPECDTPSCRLGTIRQLEDKGGWMEISYIASSVSLHVISKTKGPSWSLHDNELNMSGGKTVEWRKETANIFAQGPIIFSLPDGAVLKQLGL